MEDTIELQTEQGNLRIDTWSSKNIGKLMTAFAKAQAEMSNPVKGSINTFFKGSKYADLASCIEAALPTLNANGIAVTQMLSGEAVNTYMCLGDEWIRSECVIKANKNDAQAMGSGITYARRYSFAAITCIAQVDDDANHATSNPAKPPRLLAGLQIQTINEMLGGDMDLLDKLLKAYKVDDIKDIKSADYNSACSRIKNSQSKKVDTNA